MVSFQWFEDIFHCTLWGVSAIHGRSKWLKTRSPWPTLLTWETVPISKHMKWPLISTNLSPLHPTMLCAKFGWNWPNGFCEDFYISLFRYYLPLEKGVVLYLNKQESITITQGCFVLSLIEISPVALEKKM